MKKIHINSKTHPEVAEIILAAKTLAKYESFIVRVDEIFVLLSHQRKFDILKEVFTTLGTWLSLIEAPLLTIYNESKKVNAVIGS